MVETANAADPLSKDYVPVCAIGASAGGVGALRSLFRQLPEDLGLAYVVIVHLAPEHPSALAEILSACTGMAVYQVEDTPELRPNCVYVIPPDRELVIKGDSVTARPFTEARGRRAPIDVFFRSVAAARGDGMAVVLTGAGADGSNGVRAVCEAGGVIFVQDPGEAEFPAMPQNAIATGVVNFVAPIARLAERIAEVARSKEAVRSLDADASADELRRIVSFLRSRTGHDFSSYKRATVMRRVLRRMQVCRLTSLRDYADLIRTTPEEAQELFKDLLISVTQFFRDDKYFERLAQALAPAFEKVPDEGIRAWAVGCATGEEAYGLAILLLEEAERRDVKAPIQIFASDLDEGALATAREGRYLRSIEADVSEERLRRFFVDEGAHYRVRKQVRDVVVFASHSVLREPPFLRLDLVSCRNLMIYLERSLQEQLLRIFHYGLREGGLLFLGSAETADSVPECFTPVDRDARIYRTRDRSERRLPLLSQSDMAYPVATPDRFVRRGPDQRTDAVKSHAAALEAAAPPSVLVDESRRILHLSPNAGRYILHSGGTFSGQLSGIVRPELRLALRIALDRALDLKQPSLTLATPTAFDGDLRRIAMQVVPASNAEYGGAQALVMFLDAGRHAGEENPDDLAGVTLDHVQTLRGELHAAQEALVASRGENETAIEDLRAANEELQSINEEYRSTAEELETSKEELQSMNEELQTVNAELKLKLRSISTAHSDLRNLITATEIGTLFLDSKLRIRMFTPPMVELFNIFDMDVGRPITDFTHRLNYDLLEEDARRTLRDLQPMESEVETKDRRWFMMRLRPYRTIEDRIDGVVVTWIDITIRREMERRLTESQQRYRMLFDSIDEGFVIIEMMFDDQGRPRDYRFETVNAAFERQTGLADVIGKTARSLIPGHEEHWFEIYGRIARNNAPERFEAEAGALERFYDVYAFPLENPGDRLGVLFRDISDRKRSEAQREMLTHELSHRVKNTLAVVQSLARQKGVASLTVDEYRARFIGRIQALARAHDQLLKTQWRSADLRTLVEETLSPYGRIGERGLAIGGPVVELTPKQGLGIALVLHELATNAAKYGCLSAENGELVVSWVVESSAHVVLAWRERGGPPVTAGATEGFGAKLIRRACAYELEGSAELIFEPAGLSVTVRFPQALEGRADERDG